MTTFLNRGLRFATLLTVCAAVAACSDSTSPTGTPAARPTGAAEPMIYDGAHSGGNRAAFFLPPMVTNPDGQPGYGDPVLPGLTVRFLVKCVACASNGSDVLITDLPATFATDRYQANWDTKAQALDPARTYRILVVVGSQVVAFADVDVVSSGNELKRVDTNEFIALLDGRTLPIKVRLEQGLTFCTTSCASAVVPVSSASGETVITTPDGLSGIGVSNGWFDPNVVGSSSVIVTIEDLVPNFGNQFDCSFGLTRMNSTGNTTCLRITTEPRVANVTAPVRVGICRITGDESQLLMKYDVGEAPEFLRSVAPPVTCPPQIGAASSANPILAALDRAGTAVQRLIAPKSLYALDLGVGGEWSVGGFSIITAGHPRYMAVVRGDLQSAPIGTAVAIQPTVQVLNIHRVHVEQIPVGPNDVSVTCTVTGGGGTLNGGTSAPAVHGAEDPDGVYVCPAWIVGAGTNTLRVSSSSIDDVVFVNNQESTLPGAATFTATGIDLPAPQLALKSVSTGNADQYNLTVVNRASYPDAMFAASPNLPPCGLNTSASRTWVDIYDASTGGRIYGFCALSSAADLDNIWFALPTGTPTPRVYITLTDRLTNTVLTSNTITIATQPTGPANLSTFNNFPRTTTLTWNASSGAVTYDIDRAYCTNWTLPNYDVTCTQWIAYPVLTGVQGTTYTFDFIGAQPGRWRVRAVYPDGSVGAWSAFQYFLYTI